MLYAYLLPPSRTTFPQQAGYEAVPVAAAASHVLTECWRILTCRKSHKKFGNSYLTS